MADSNMQLQWTDEQWRALTALYDGNLNPGGASRACPDSGVEYVSVTDLSGALLDPLNPTIPCVYAGVQGATFASFAPGTYPIVVHGYRTVGLTPVEVHRGQRTVDHAVPDRRQGGGATADQAIDQELGQDCHHASFPGWQAFRREACQPSCSLFLLEDDPLAVLDVHPLVDALRNPVLVELLCARRTHIGG